MPNNTLRQTLRARRRALTVTAQHQASMNLVERCTRTTMWQTSHTISAYIAFDGEIDPQPLIHAAWQANKQVVLPVLDPKRKGELLFMHYTPTTQMTTNRFGIAEPVFTPQNTSAISSVDILFIPLVGFDEAGNRMGMGGGFYDRTLAKIQHFSTPDKSRSPDTTSRPWFIGVAHACQAVTQLTQASWDIPMDYIITDKNILSAKAQ